MLEDLLRTGLKELSVDYDETAIGRFRKYFSLLEETNKVMNLTAISGEDAVASLHFLDCAAVLTKAEITGKTLIDIGTGAGFPGLVLKILRPDSSVILIDSLDKRIGFLKETCELLELRGVACVHARAEEAAESWREKGDVVTSRAVAGLNVLSELCLPYVKENGVFVSMKGPDYDAELEAAKNAIRELGGKTCSCSRYTVPGTDAVHSLIVIGKKRPTPSGYPRRWAQIKKSPLV